MTRYLLDTHVIYRWMRDDRRFGREMRRIPFGLRRERSGSDLLC